MPFPPASPPTISNVHCIALCQPYSSIALNVLDPSTSIPLCNMPSAFITSHDDTSNSRDHFACSTNCFWVNSNGLTNVILAPVQSVANTPFYCSENSIVQRVILPQEIRLFREVWSKLCNAHLDRRLKPSCYCLPRSFFLDLQQSAAKCI